MDEAPRAIRTAIEVRPETTMSDHERGAYTPQYEAPLQFDPRSPRSRRPLPLALIGSATVLVVLVAAVGMHYLQGGRPQTQPPRSVGEPVASIKAAPPATAQPSDPAGGLDVYAAQDVPARGAAASAAPVFAPAPEEVRPRPAAPERRLALQTVDADAPARITETRPVAARPIGPAYHAPTPQEISAPPLAADDAPVATVRKAPDAATRAAAVGSRLAVASAPQPVAARAVATTKPEAKAAASTPKHARLAVADDAAPARTASAGRAVVQIGAFSSAALADKGYGDVSAAMPGRMGGKRKAVLALAHDGHTLYRTSVTGFGDRASAIAFCEALRSKGKTCIVKS